MSMMMIPSFFELPAGHYVHIISRISTCVTKNLNLKIRLCWPRERCKTFTLVYLRKIKRRLTLKNYSWSSYSNWPLIIHTNLSYIKFIFAGITCVGLNRNLCERCHQYNANPLTPANNQVVASTSSDTIKKTSAKLLAQATEFLAL